MPGTFAGEDDLAFLPILIEHAFEQLIDFSGAPTPEVLRPSAWAAGTVAKFAIAAELGKKRQWQSR